MKKIFRFFLIFLRRRKVAGLQAVRLKRIETEMDLLEKELENDNLDWIQIWYSLNCTELNSSLILKLPPAKRRHLHDLALRIRSLFDLEKEVIKDGLDYNLERALRRLEEKIY